MDIVLLFMKLEDKYWGIFLAALFFLFAYVQKCRQEKHENARKYLFLSIYGCAAYLLFLCPLTYAFVQRFVPALSGYYELSHMELVVPIIATASATAVLWAAKEGKKNAVCLLAGLFVLFLVSGDFVYASKVVPTWETQQMQVYDMILAHAGQQEDEEKIRIWGMEELMAESRLYDDAFCPIYGKDMGEYPQNYSNSLQYLYQGYASYDVEGGTSINIGDQLDALALLPYRYPETNCEYLILYDPKEQFEDYELYCGDGFDASERVVSHGYEFVGETEHLLVFCRQEG